jgi:hypothetical protein
MGNPTVTSLKIPLAKRKEQKAITNLFLLSFAELSSCRYNLFKRRTVGRPWGEGGM